MALDCNKAAILPFFAVLSAIAHGGRLIIPRMAMIYKVAQLYKCVGGADLILRQAQNER